MSRSAIILAALGLVALAGSADARAHRHRYRVVHAEPHRFVYPTPQDAAHAADIGKLAGYLLDTGIAGPTTADPYERPTSGYDELGRYGPGYVYPGY